MSLHTRARWLMPLSSNFSFLVPIDASPSARDPGDVRTVKVLVDAGDLPVGDRRDDARGQLDLGAVELRELQHVLLDEAAVELGAADALVAALAEVGRHPRQHPQVAGDVLLDL